MLDVPLDLEGLSATSDADGNLRFTRPSGLVVFASDPAVMFDGSRGPGDEPLHKTEVGTTIVKTAEGPVLRLTPDEKFLADPSLIYPVTIDPTPNLAVLKDAVVESALPNTPDTTGEFLKAGTPDASDKFRSFVKFDVSEIKDTHILSSSLNLFETYSGSCTNKQMDVHRITSSWESPTWNSQPTYGAIYASKSFAAGFSSSCPNAWITIDDSNPNGGRTLSQLVQIWADDGAQNYGVALRAASETQANAWKKFKSSDSATNVPYLTVTYNSYPDAPTNVGVEDGSTTPTLHARFEDPDGGQGRARYTIVDMEGGVVVSDGSGVTVLSGADSEYTVPPDVLDADQIYEWSVMNDDGTDVSAAVQGGVLVTSADGPTDEYVTVVDGDGLLAQQVEPNPWGCRITWPDGDPHASTRYPGNGWINAKHTSVCDSFVPSNVFIRNVATLQRSRWWGWESVVKTEHRCSPEYAGLVTNYSGRPWEASTDCSPNYGPLSWFTATSWDCPNGTEHNYRITIYGAIRQGTTKWQVWRERENAPYSVPGEILCPG